MCLTIYNALWIQNNIPHQTIIKEKNEQMWSFSSISKIVLSLNNLSLFILNIACLQKWQKINVFMLPVCFVLFIWLFIWLLGFLLKCVIGFYQNYYGQNRSLDFSSPLSKKLFLPNQKIASPPTLLIKWKLFLIPLLLAPKIIC